MKHIDFNIIFSQIGKLIQIRNYIFTCSLLYRLFHSDVNMQNEVIKEYMLLSSIDTASCIRVTISGQFYSVSLLEVNVWTPKAKECIRCTMKTYYVCIIHNLSLWGSCASLFVLVFNKKQLIVILGHVFRTEQHIPAADCTYNVLLILKTYGSGNIMFSIEALDILNIIFPKIWWIWCFIIFRKHHHVWY